MPKAPSTTAKRTVAPAGSKRCSFCKEFFGSQGITRHEAKCEQERQEDSEGREFERELRRNARRRRAQRLPAGDFVGTAPHNDFQMEDWGNNIPERDEGQTPPRADEQPATPEPDLDEPQYNHDDIHTRYHPRSGRENLERVDAFGDYNDDPPDPPHVLNPIPWSPFESLDEFKLAEVLLRAGLPHKDVDKVLQTVQSLIEAGTPLSLKNHKDLLDRWEKASRKLTPFERHDIDVEYDGDKLKFDFWCRPLWDWLTDILENPQLAPLFTWDAVELSKFDAESEEWVRFVHEPWTGDRWWNIQSRLPEGAKPVCMLIYADKTKLSSFSTQAVYPVIAQCLNLPSHIRNGTGLGAGRVVGWLPILEEDEDEKGKKRYVDFKRVIWHDSCKVLFETVRGKSFTGVYFRCGDGIERLLFPVVLILSADYEEQCVMAAIRGQKGLRPCPICLVPLDQFADLTIEHPRRTALDSYNAVESARRPDITKTASEEILKALGLRDVDNVFWGINYSDPYEALSFDPLHNYASGLGGRHIWPRLSRHIEDLGRSSLGLLDYQVSQMPRWPTFYHFTKVITVEFTDASKFEDLMKQLMFTSHNILTPASSPAGNLLLLCLRSYINLAVYAAMTVHTERTIEAGRKEVLRFASRFQRYSDALGVNESGKPVWNINFPKAHMHTHLFDDILDKGVTLNYTTKINERLHGPIKDAYYRTNFRDIAPQILRLDHYLLTAIHIQDQIDHLPRPLIEKPRTRFDNPLPNQAQSDNDLLSTSNGSVERLPREEDNDSFGNISLGAPQSLMSFRDLRNDATRPHGLFTTFCEEFSEFLLTFLPQENLPVPRSAPHQLPDHHKVREYRFLRVRYESGINWRLSQDLLRCNPSFYNHERFDNVMINDDSGILFGKLAFLFTYRLDNEKDAKELPFAIVQFYEFEDPTPESCELELIRLSLPDDKPYEIIPARSIIRGALICPEFSDPTLYHVVDVIDPDMFLRVRGLFPQYFSNPQ
ncbi:hypothetical protein BDN72DRAFT_438464 [Pluteus cervinus]|uniref:Uncharacterized protein n=1 Tax=Pluteus cervinus TaxID=181527 RepID=A0ACD3A837_9AGAR|nr:hypothetical protein BDN72DRAFT_438464 [Pluteus cervinus]